MAQPTTIDIDLPVLHKMVLNDDSASPSPEFQEIVCAIDAIVVFIAVTLMLLTVKNAAAFL